MKFVALTVVSIVIFDVSYGLKCTEDSACLTLSDMGTDWRGLFQDQENAPCLAGLLVGSDIVSCTDEKQISLKIDDLVQVFLV